MDNRQIESTVISEDLWRAWTEKGKRKQKAAARKTRRLVGLVLSLLSLGVGLYFLAVR